MRAGKIVVPAGHAKSLTRVIVRLSAPPLAVWNASRGLASAAHSARLDTHTVAARAYVASLASATTPGARYFMLCFSDEQPRDWGPHRISRSEIVAGFADGWRIEAIDPARIEVTIDPDGIRAWSVAATRV